MSITDLVKRQARVGSASFINALDTHLTAEPWTYKEGYHPSSISYKLCPRQIALIRLGFLVPYQDIDARLQRIFDDGHSRHARFQAWTREMGLVVKHERFDTPGNLGQEVRLKHPVGISGRCDDILDLEPGVWDVVDYKGAKASVFDTLIQPLASHEKQVIIYLGLMEHLFDGEPPAKLRGRIVYECKDDQRLKEFTIEWTEERREGWQELIGILESINAAVSEKEPLSVPCTCGNCDAYSLEDLKAAPKKVRT